MTRRKVGAAKNVEGGLAERNERNEKRGWGIGFSMLSSTSDSEYDVKPPGLPID